MVKTQSDFDNLPLPFDIPEDLSNDLLKKHLASKITILIEAKKQLNDKVKSQYRYYRNRPKDKDYYTWVNWSKRYRKKLTKEKDRLISIQTELKKRV